MQSSSVGLNKIDYLDGLRGVAAFVVVVAHLITGFYPALYTGDIRQSHNSWEVWAAGSPFNLVSMGNCFVCIFFMLSAYVLTYSVLGKKRENYLPSLFIGRYVRLTLPILASSFIAYLILAGGWTAHVQSATVSHSYWWLPTLYQFEPNFFAMVEESLYGVYQFNTVYNPVLWTMRIELLGSFMVFGILFFCRAVSMRMVAYAVISVFFFSPYYFCFIAGMFFYDIRQWSSHEHAASNAAGKLVTAMLIAAGLFLGAYPYAYTIGTWYQGVAALLVPKLSESAIVIAHLMGAILLMLAVERSQRMRKMLRSPVCQYWGRNAFAIYLLHLILIASVFSGIFNRILVWLPYNAAFVVATLVFFAVLFVASNALFHFVDGPSVRLSRKIARILERAQERWQLRIAARWKGA